MTENGLSPASTPGLGKLASAHNQLGPSLIPSPKLAFLNSFLPSSSPQPHKHNINIWTTLDIFNTFLPREYQSYNRKHGW